MWVYSAQTIYNSDPLKRPNEEGYLMKNEVDKEDVDKVLNVFDKINQDSNSPSSSRKKWERIYINIFKKFI